LKTEGDVFRDADWQVRRMPAATFPGESDMRLIVFIVAILISGGPAVAQSWREYSYPDLFFAVAFPSDPQMETTRYQADADRAVEAHVYSVDQEDAVFKVTVAELKDTGLDEGAVIDHAIKTMSQDGEVRINIPTASTGSTAGSSAS
jgi:hypothetical protein